jgi:predicted GH43/DUF377 family glycosyl hydrolase
MGISSNPKLIPISVAQHAHTTIIIYKEIGDAFSLPVSLRVATSTDGMQFKLHPEPLVLAHTIKNEKIEDCTNIRLSVVGDEYVLSYEKKIASTKIKGAISIKKSLVIVRSLNLNKFKIKKSVPYPKDLNHSGFIVSLGHHGSAAKKNEYVIYYGSPTITAAHSTNLEKWETSGALLLSPRSGFFDHGHLSIIAAHSITEGIAILYQTRSYEHGKEQLLVGGALFAHDNPNKILWRSEAPLWDHEYDKSSGAEPAWTACGAIFKKDSIFIYLASKDGDLSVIAIPNRFHLLSNKKTNPPTDIRRHTANPIVSPGPHHEWQSQATFNAAAVEADGRIHLIYRAMGGDGVSRLGHVSGKDGAYFDECTPYPIYEPTAGFGLPNEEHMKGPRRYDPIFYASGGGWAGCEDPRMVKIGGKIYVTFNSFESWECIRVAVLSISVKDFLAKKWKWNRPLLISPSGEVNKNWVLFPEKIKGKFAILHNIWPKIGIEYVTRLSDLADGTHPVPKYWHAGAKYPGMPDSWVLVNSGTPGSRWADPKHLEKNVWDTKARKNSWDTWIRSVGPPPVKTDKGWLVLYHAMDKMEPNIGYKLGALLLDLDNPEKIIARSPVPILSPNKWYENDWKLGVVYACGALIKDGNLMVYYGGGDKHVCLAETPLDKLLDWLRRYGKVE